MNIITERVTLTDPVHLNKYTGDVAVVNICPICNHACKPIITNSLIVPRQTDAPYSLHCYCTNCKSFFIVNGTFENQDRTSGHFRNARINTAVPKSYISTTFSDRINNVSKDFQTIFNQAEATEALEYNHIAGIGFRKALEYIITDYLLFLNKGNEKEIKWLSSPKTTLNQKILKIDNVKIQNTSRAAAWIGNDETHYFKQHEDKDINDLKDYLKTVIYFIDFDLSTYDASDFVNPNKD